MLQIGNKPIDTMYVGGKLVQQAYLGSTKVYPLHGVIPKAIKDAMVLWYDLKRQGATNESMAENPVLRDLSGNGHDATCYNFAWTEESGISTTNYPHALVSDGVDDYCLVEGLPLLNKEDGYTVIAKRKWLQDINRNALVSRNVIWETEELGGIDGAFNIECNTAMCYSFGQGKLFVFNNLDGFIYQTSKSYNGKDLAIGDKEDNNHLCIAAINKGTTWFSSIAIYSLLLFDRDLTPEEIEWVKTNLIETEQ